MGNPGSRSLAHAQLHWTSLFSHYFFIDTLHERRIRRLSATEHTVCGAPSGLLPHRFVVSPRRAPLVRHRDDDVLETGPAQAFRVKIDDMITA
jgi:hypothetical protein